MSSLGLWPSEYFFNNPDASHRQVVAAALQEVLQAWIFKSSRDWSLIDQEACKMRRTQAATTAEGSPNGDT